MGAELVPLLVDLQGVADTTTLPGVAQSLDPESARDRLYVLPGVMEKDSYRRTVTNYHTLSLRGSANSERQSDFAKTDPKKGIRASRVRRLAISSTFSAALY